MALADLDQALDFSPEHLSWYQLTIEPNTVFFNRPPQQPSHDALADISSAGRALLKQSGLTGMRSPPLPSKVVNVAITCTIGSLMTILGLVQAPTGKW